MDRRIKLRHLEAFVEIARLGQLKLAARTLSLTQPAITRTLKELEEIVGVRLFDRDRAGAVLTAEGGLFWQFAHAGLGTLDQGLEKLAEMRKGGSASLRIGALPSVAARLLPETVIAMRAMSPDIAITLEDGKHRVLVDRLRSGSLDMVIGRLGPPDTMQGIVFAQLYLEHVAMVVRPGHPMQNDRSLERLRDFTVIYPNEDAAIRPLVDRMIQASGIVSIPQRIESVSGAFGRAMVQSTDAVWFISRGVVAADLAAGRLSRVNLDMTLTAGPVGLMMRANEAQTPVQQMFARALSEVASGLDTQ